jgi:hypothetical protein
MLERVCEHGNNGKLFNGKLLISEQREIDAPTPDWTVNFPCVIQNDYIIRILQHFATKLWNITNFVMLFQVVMKFLSKSKF